jgi:hypothetical protein
MNHIHQADGILLIHQADGLNGCPNETGALRRTVF